MIIAISGKIGSGKDIIGKIIQYLTDIDTSSDSTTFEQYLSIVNAGLISKFEIKKLAGKLKQIISILTGIPVEDLEKQEVKEQLLGKEWIRYGYANGFIQKDGKNTMNNEACSKEKYEEELKINWQTAYKHHYTVRDLLQLVGTEAMRNVIHPNIWVNALFADYKVHPNYWISKADYDLETKGECIPSEDFYPNWIITDLRFPNELEAVKERDGITIRVNRTVKHKIESKKGKFELDDIYEPTYQHPSETALDNAEFDYTIDNNSTIENLIEKVKEILIKEKII